MTFEKAIRWLLDEGKVTPSQLEEARRTQGFFGGQLESHLLKLGFVDEGTLGEALTAATGAPFASPERLRLVPPEVLALVPAELAGRLHACPFSVEDEKLRVAMVNPLDARAFSEIEAVVRRVVEPWVTSEYRLLQTIERHYRIRGPAARAIAVKSGGPRPGTSGSTRSASQPPERRAPTEPEVGLDGRPLDAPIRLDEAGFGPPVETHWEQDHGSAAGPLGAHGRGESKGADGTWPVEVSTMAALEAALIAACNRDELADALLDFCMTKARRAALFVIAKEGIRGLTGRGRAFDSERLRRMVLAAGTSSIFDTALMSRDFYYGVVPPLPANRDLYTYLGGKLPATVLLVPIVVKDRQAALLYMDGDDRPLERPDIPLFRRVAAKAGLAFEMLILRGKLREI